MCSYEGDDSMAKKNLIKSTTQKKADAKAEKKTVTKKSTAKKTAKTTKKSAAGATKKSSATTAKKKAAPAAKKTATKKAAPKKTTAKKTTATKAKAAPKKAKPKKIVSVKELVFKKFEPTGALPEAMPAPKPAAVSVSAPPLISSSDPKEVERIRALLFNQFDMDAIKAAAKAPAPASDPAPATEAEPEAATAAPPQAPAKVITASDADAEAPAQGPAKVITASDAEQPAEKAYISVEPASDSAGDPMNRIVKIAVAAAATVVFLLLAISYNNSSKYYIYPKDNAIEIWKGQFSPKDKAFFMVLHGTPAVEPVKESYTEKDVFPLVFNYLVDKADTLLEVPGLPDFEGIKNYLHQARNYVVDNEMQTAVTTRLNNIERMTLLYKADVAISKDNVVALGSAIGLLKKASMLTHSSAQEDEIAQKIEQALARRAELKSVTE